MSKIVLLNRKKMQFYAILAVVVILAGAYIGWQQSKPTMAPADKNVQVRQLLTVEFTTEMEDGTKLESYRWDPGTIIVQKGQPVELRISGINGQSHPFVIEGLNIKAEVTKGKTTIVRFTPKVAGTYPMICLTHGSADNNAPMIGYLTVQ